MSKHYMRVYTEGMVRDRTLSSYEKLVLLVIMSYGDDVFVSIPTVAADAGISISSVSRALKTLREKGALSWERRSNQTSLYTVSSKYIP